MVLSGGLFSVRNETLTLRNPKNKTKHFWAFQYSINTFEFMAKGGAQSTIFDNDLDNPEHTQGLTRMDLTKNENMLLFVKELNPVLLNWLPAMPTVILPPMVSAH